MFFSVLLQSLRKAACFSSAIKCSLISKKSLHNFSCNTSTVSQEPPKSAGNEDRGTNSAWNFSRSSDDEWRCIWNWELHNFEVISKGFCQLTFWATSAFINGLISVITRWKNGTVLKIWISWILIGKASWMNAKNFFIDRKLLRSMWPELKFLMS